VNREPDWAITPASRLISDDGVCDDTRTVFTVAADSSDESTGLRADICVYVDTGFICADCRYTTVAHTPSSWDAGVSSPAVCDVYPVGGVTGAGGTEGLRNAESTTSVNVPNPSAVMFGYTFR